MNECWSAKRKDIGQGLFNVNKHLRIKIVNPITHFSFIKMIIREILTQNTIVKKTNKYI